MKATRYKDYCFRTFDITLQGVDYTVSAKVWYSYENKPQGIMTEHLGETLTDSVRVNNEIDWELFDIEKLKYDGSTQLLVDEDFMQRFHKEQTIEDLIEEELKKDYTQYFSLD